VGTIVLLEDGGSWKKVCSGRNGLAAPRKGSLMVTGDGEGGWWIAVSCEESFLNLKETTYGAEIVVLLLFHLTGEGKFRQRGS